MTPQDKTATASVLEFMLGTSPITATWSAAEIATHTDLTEESVAAALVVLEARGIVRPVATAPSFYRLSPSGLAAAACSLRDETPAADWTTGAYVSDVSRADHGRIVLTVPGGPDRIEKATVTVDGSEATTRLLAGMLGQKGTLRFHVGEADHDLAGALADRRAEVTRLRELLVAAQESMGLQVVRVERGHGVVIICTAQGAHEKALADEMGAWMLEQGMRHPVARAEQEKWLARVDEAQRLAAHTICLLHGLYTRARGVLDVLDEGESEAVDALHAFVASFPEETWEQAAEVARQVEAARAAKASTPAPEQA